MTRRTLQILVAVLSLALLAACFRIYNLSEKSTEHNNANSNSAIVTDAAQKNTTLRTKDAAAKPQDRVDLNSTETRSNAKVKPSYDSDLATIDYVALPKEAQTVIRMIQSRSDFPYRQDGQTFGNREGILPAQSRGYYQEYTVPTPGADNRGARRIVSGKGTTGENATSGEYYYTSDHYRSFRQVRME